MFAFVCIFPTLMFFLPFLKVITKKFTQTNPGKANPSGAKAKQRTAKQYKTQKA